VFRKYLRVYEICTSRIFNSILILLLLLVVVVVVLSSFLPSVSMIPRDLEKKYYKMVEWPLLRAVVANEGVVEQHAIKSLHQDGQTLK